MIPRPILYGAVGVVAVFAGLVMILGNGTSEATPQHGRQMTTVLVATTDIEAGTTVGEATKTGALKSTTVADADRRTGAVASAVLAQGRRIVVPVSKGDQLVDSQLSRPSLRSSAIEVPEGTEAIAVEVPFAAGGAGYITVGDRVNVLALIDESAGHAGAAPAGPETVLVEAGVRVLDVSTELAPRTAGATAGATATTTPGASGATAPPPSQLTYLVAVPTADVERVVQAIAYHRVYLSLPADNGTAAPSAERRSSDPDLTNGTGA